MTQARDPGRGKRQLLAWLGAFAFCCATPECLAQEPLRITFDGQPPGTSFFIQQYFESGMWFRPLGVVGPGNGFGRTGGGISFFPENGTAYLQALQGDSLQFSFSIGSPFNLMSVDLAEYSTTVPDPVTVHFIGYRLDGSIVTQDFTTDGIIDGTGPGVDFQTFQFSPEFANLTRVEVPTFGWSMDNLVVVPEPSTWGLISVGAVVTTILLRKGKRGQVSCANDFQQSR